MGLKIVSLKMGCIDTAIVHCNGLSRVYLNVYNVYWRSTISVLASARVHPRVQQFQVIAPVLTPQLLHLTPISQSLNTQRFSSHAIFDVCQAAPFLWILWLRTMASKVPAAGKRRRHADSYLLILEVTLVTSAHGSLFRTFDPLQGSLGNVRSMRNMDEQGSALVCICVYVCVWLGCLTGCWCKTPVCAFCISAEPQHCCSPPSVPLKHSSWASLPQRLAQSRCFIISV